jgi:hypothetical protein
VQQRIVDMVFGEVAPTFGVIGTPRETLRRAAAAYIDTVGWRRARLTQREDAGDTEEHFAAAFEFDSKFGREHLVFE